MKPKTDFQGPFFCRALLTLAVLLCLPVHADVDDFLQDTNLTSLKIAYDSAPLNRDVTIGHKLYKSIPNRIDPVLPPNFDLEGTWRLDSVPPPVIFPNGNNIFTADFFQVYQLEMDHYGVDTMTLKRKGFQEIVPGQGTEDSPTNLVFNKTNSYNDSPGESAFPPIGSERLLIYYYGGTLTHRISIGCPENPQPYPGSISLFYDVPQRTAFIQDVTYNLDAMLVLTFDTNGNFVWSDFVFKGIATNTPAYPEIPTNIFAQEGYYFPEDANGEILGTNNWNYPYEAPFLGVFQSLDGNAIAINGGGIFPGGGSTDGDAGLSGLDVPELGAQCNGGNAGIRLFSFGPTALTGGAILYYPGTTNLIGEFSHAFWRRLQGPANGLPTGNILGHLSDPSTHLTITNATINLLFENTVLRSPTNGEDPSSYNAYVASNGFVRATASVDSQGNFGFTNVALFEPYGTASGGLLAAQYAVVVNNAQANSSFDTNNPVTYFQDTSVANLIPQMPATSTNIPLQSLSDLGTKKLLAAALAAISPSNYRPDETTVYNDIITYIANSGTVTQNQIEGVRRAIWSERVLREGANEANGIIPAMLKALASVMNDALSFIPNTSGRGVQGDKLITQVSSGPGSQVLLSKFKVPASVAGNAEATIQLLIKDGQSFQSLNIIDSILDGIGSSINTALQISGQDASHSATVTGGIQKILKVMLAVYRYQSGIGAASKAPPSAVLDTIVPLFAPVVFDGTIIPSYCSLTTPLVHNSRVWMETWATNNAAAYSVDSQRAANYLNDMAERERSVLSIMGYLTAFTQTAGDSSKVLGAIGDVSGQKYFTLASKITGILEKVGNSASLGLPVAYVYSTIPTFTSNGVYAAFGHTNTASAIPRSPSKAQRLDFSSGNPNSVLSNSLAQAYTQLNSAISTIQGGLGSNDFGVIYAEMASNSPTFGDAVANWKRVTARIRQQAGTSTNLTFPDDFMTSLSTEEASFALLADGYDYELVGMLQKILGGTYTDVTDTNYLADQASAQIDVQTFLATFNKQNTLLQNVLSSWDISSGSATVDIVLSMPVSQTTGLPWVTTNNEVFDLIGFVTNTGAVTVSNLTLSLGLQGDTNAATNLNALVLPASPLTLAAGQGAGVVWHLQYTGGLDSASTFLVVDALENATNPVSFTYDAQSRVLQVSPSLVDSDGDGIPDDWMQHYFGHPHGQVSDNSLASDPAPNGDGNTIFEDYQSGLSPVMTNAVVATVAPTAVNLILSTNRIVLGPSNFVASVTVSSGTNDSYWTATLDDPNVASLSPSSPDLATNGDTLTLSIPLSYNFAASPPIQTVVRVTPSGLSSGTAQAITLVVQGFVTNTVTPPSGTLPLIVTPPAGGQVAIGSNFVLTVIATGTAPLSYQWQFNGANIQGATNATLLLSNIQTNNAGTYRVIVTDTAGSVTSIGAMLTVPLTTTTSIVITTQPKPGPVLHVTAKGTGVLHYQWLLNGVALPKATGASLALPSPQAGSYTVVVSNLNGVVTSSPVVVAGLRVQTNGSGKIQRGFSGTNLFVGLNYTVTATPLPNCVFSNWQGGTNFSFVALSTNAKFKFEMQPGLTVVADFATNRFAAAAGTYQGLFAPTNLPLNATNSGAFTLTLTPARAFSGLLRFATGNVPMHGEFNLTGAATAASVRHGLPTLATLLQLDFTNQSVSGTVSNSDFTAALSGDRAVFSSREKAVAFSGQYSVVMPGTTNGATVGPAGPSVGTAKIDPTGKMSFAGALADGTTLTESSIISKDGVVPFFAPLYGGHGFLWGWDQFTSNHTFSSSVPFVWINSTNRVPTALYRGGFTNEQVEMVGTAYASTARPIAGFTNATLVFTGGGLAAPFTNHISISATGVIKVLDTNSASHSLNLRIADPTGIVSGSVIVPALSTKPLKIEGVLIQQTPAATGWFLGPIQSGQVLIQPTE